MNSPQPPITEDAEPYRPLQVRALHDPEAFMQEQSSIGKQWQFVGYEIDLSKSGDWIRARLGGEEIFVQRFDEGLRGFVNRCAHRHHPIRTEDAGNGPVFCPFHEWRYDKTGLAYGIPKCREIYGKSPKELDARLKPVDVDTIGGFVFARLVSEAKGDRDADRGSLSDWLGAGASILNHLGTATPMRYKIDREVNAHWTLMMQISLDEYHVVGVHPTTFGKDGYLDTEGLKYFRFGAHSAYCPDQDDDHLDGVVKQCEAGDWVPDEYHIFQFFPNLIVAVSFTPEIFGKEFVVVIVQHLQPLAHNKTRTQTRLFVLDGHEDTLGKFMMPIFSLGTWYTSRKIHTEDNDCVQLVQSAAAGVDAPPLISAQEERIAWFNEEYARYTEK